MHLAVGLKRKTEIILGPILARTVCPILSKSMCLWLGEYLTRVSLGTRPLYVSALEH